MDHKKMSPEQLIAEVEKLKAELTSANETALAEVQKLRDEIVSKHEELEKLKAELTSANETALAEVQKLRDEIVSKHEELEKLRGELTSANETALAEVQKLRDEIVSKDEQLVAAKEEAALTVEINNELSARIEILSKAAPVEEKEVVSTSKVTISGETFEVDGKKKTFQFSKMQHKGKSITAAEVLASEELQRELVAIDSRMIKDAD